MKLELCLRCVCFHEEGFCPHEIHDEATRLRGQLRIAEQFIPVERMQQYVARLREAELEDSQVA